MNNLLNKKCVPCEVGGASLPIEKINSYHALVSSWQVVNDDIKPMRLEHEFNFKNFMEAMNFVNKVSVLSESEGHHPDIYIFYNKVKLTLYTHAVQGLSENDFILASKINEIKI